MARRQTKQEIINEIAKYKRLQNEQPELNFEEVIHQLWKELYEMLDWEIDKGGESCPRK